MPVTVINARNQFAGAVVEITIHDGRVVQIQRKERFRFPAEQPDPKPRD